MNKQMLFRATSSSTIIQPAGGTRIYTYQHRPIPSAVVGNTDPFPVGTNGKVAFERAPQAGLPAANTRRTNSLILDWTGKPYINLNEGQKALAL